MTTSLPWPLVRLEDLVQSGRAIAYGVLKPGPRTPDGVPMLRVTDITSNRVDESDIYPISPGLSNEFRRTQLHGGEILVSIQGTVGRVAHVPVRMKGANVSRTLAVIPPAVPELSAWLWIMLQTPQVQEQMRALTGGTTRDSLNLRDLRLVEVPVAPTSQQLSVFAAIESYFTRLDDAVATLERVQRNLKRYRASVLKAAVEGRLVPTEAELARAERRDYEPASVLLERILTERRRRWEDAGGSSRYQEPARPDTSRLPGLPEGWCWATTDQLFSFVTSGSRGWARFYSNTGPLFIRIGNLDHDSIALDLTDVTRVRPPAGAEGMRTCIRPGDILVSITADVGMIALAGESVGEAYINQHVSLARPVPGPCFAYLAWYLASHDGQKQLGSMQRGATKVGLGLDNIRSVSVPLPPGDEQRRMVADAERYFSQVEEVAATTARSLLRCARLRQSILKWAFEGRLADQDPSDEPASVLLDRIKAERAASTTTKQTRRSNGRERKTA